MAPHDGGSLLLSEGGERIEHGLTDRDPLLDRGRSATLGRAALSDVPIEQRAAAPPADLVDHGGPQVGGKRFDATLPPADPHPCRCLGDHILGIRRPAGQQHREAHQPVLEPDDHVGELHRIRCRRSVL